MNVDRDTYGRIVPNVYGAISDLEMAINFCSLLYSLVAEVFTMNMHRFMNMIMRDLKRILFGGMYGHLILMLNPQNVENSEALEDVVDGPSVCRGANLPVSCPTG